jgi:hypothetical protein
MRHNEVVSISSMAAIKKYEYANAINLVSNTFNACGKSIQRQLVLKWTARCARWSTQSKYTTTRDDLAPTTWPNKRLMPSDGPHLFGAS